jgi:WD40 repeat protein
MFHFSISAIFFMFLPIARLTGHSADVSRARISQALDTLTTVSADKSAIIWDLSTGKALRSLDGHSKEVTDCVYHGTSNGVMTSCMDGVARLFDLRSSRSTAVVTLPKPSSQENAEGLTCLTTGNNGNSPLLITGSAMGNIQFFDLRSLRLCTSSFSHYNSICSLETSPDDTMIVSSSLDSTIRIWSAHKGDCLLSYNNGNSNPSPCVYGGFTSDSKGVIGLFLGSSIIRMDLSDRVYPREKLSGPTISNSTKTFARIDSHGGIAVPSEDGSIHFLGGRHSQRPMKAHADDCLSVDCRGDILVSTGAGEDSSAVIWVRQPLGEVPPEDYKMTFNLVSPLIEGLL